MSFQLIEQVGLFLPEWKHRGRVPGPSPRVRPPVNLHKTIGIVERDRVEKERIDDREHDRCGADSQRQRDDGSGGETGTPAETTQTVLQVLKEDIELSQAERLSRLLPILLPGSEFDAGHSKRLRFIDAFQRHQVMRARLDVKFQFVCNIRFQTAAIQ